MVSAVVFDVGETLVRDDAVWNRWADWLHAPRHTLSALVGAVVALGMDNAEALRLLRPGIDIEAELHAMREAGLDEELDEGDLYPDVRDGLKALKKQGLRVCVAGNQTARAAALLRALDLPVDAVATSGEWDVAKPHPGFFARVLDLAGTTADETVYVGDHPANDIEPAKTAGLRTCLIRRGPYGHLWAHTAADWHIDSIPELAALLAK